MISACRRYVSLRRSERRLVVEAALLIAAVRAGLFTLRFLRLRRLLGGLVAFTASRTSRPADPQSIEAIRWAVAAVAARIPSATCLVQALAADAMLRRRGIAAEIRFGVRVPGEGETPIEGHAWVECGDGAVIGPAERQSEFKTLSGGTSP